MEPPNRAASQVRLDDQGRILDDDLTCLSCGYNVRGLAPDGICPECGTDTGRSIHGDHLRFCDPHWVGRLALSAQFIIAALLVYFLLGCCCGGCGLPNNMGQASIATSVALVIAAALRFIGYWFLTTPDPSKSGSDGSLDVRRVARAAGFVQFPVALILPHTSIFGHMPTAVGLTAANVAIGLVALLAIFIYARRLAVRIPDRQLASQTRLVMRGLAASYLLVGAVTVAVTAVLGGTGAPTPNPPGIALAFAAVLAVAVLVFFGWALLLADTYLKALNVAALQARLNWALDPRRARAFH